jgi:putative oxidoreductase
MKRFFSAPSYSKHVDLALLLLRLVFGFAFIHHGWGKIQNPFGWMPDSPIPGFFQFLAALSEFGGGIAVVLGLVTRLGALGMAFTMLVAIYMHKFAMGDPFVHPTGGRSYELAAVFFSIAILFLAAGPGRFSVDRKLFGPGSSAN